MYLIAAVIVFIILLIYIFYQFRIYSRLKKKLLATEKELSGIQQFHEASVKELAELKAEILTNLTTDKLTGLPSRQIFDDHISQLILESQRYHLQFAVLFFDIDKFKVIQDGLGIDGGDELLKAVAERLRGHVRQVDLVCRLRADEFVILLSRISRPEMAAYVAERLLKATELPYHIKNQEIFITSTIGISVYPTDAQSAVELINNAESSLHQAKASSARLLFYHKAMNETSRRELILRSHLHDPRIYDEFVVYYQPQFDATLNILTAVEAMLFWQNREFGLLPFKSFLTLSENVGNLINITEWWLRQVGHDFRAWGHLVPRIELKTTQRQLENPHFVFKISQILKETDIKPDTLTLEISDWSEYSNLHVSEKTLKMFRSLGIGMSISDFGTGQISLRHLQLFPLQGIKISPELIQDMDKNSETKAIIKMIIALAKALGIQVVASGVSSLDQKDQLLAMGCRYMQGEVFTCPLLSTDFSGFLKQKLVVS